MLVLVLRPRPRIRPSAQKIEHEHEGRGRGRTRLAHGRDARPIFEVEASVEPLVGASLRAHRRMNEEVLFPQIGAYGVTRAASAIRSMGAKREQFRRILSLKAV